MLYAILSSCVDRCSGDVALAASEITRPLRIYKHPGPLLKSSSLCSGITHISEDSSEIVYLLVENFNLTAPECEPSWFACREFLDPFFIFSPFYAQGFDCEDVASV